MAFTLPIYRAPDFAELGLSGAPDVRTLPAPRDGVAPEGYHATTMYPEYYRLHGNWTLAADSRMDCVAVVRGETVDIVEFRRLKAGDAVVVGRSEDGSEGIFLWTEGFSIENASAEVFSFRQGRSRETAYSRDYDALYDLLRHDREHGSILWVLGPACAFDAHAREAFAALVRGGYVHGLMAGNALATHDLEAGYLGTALGQDIYTQRSAPQGHYHHIDTINAVRALGSIPAFIASGAVKDGILYECVKKDVPFVLVGSVRDDGPLPEVYADVYQGQDAMRSLIRRATTIICMATTLHTIATGNMTPAYRVVNGTVRPVYFYSVDVSEFSLNKLHDRGSLTAKTMVANVQDFVRNVREGLGA